MNERIIFVDEPFKDKHISLIKKASGDEFTVYTKDQGVSPMDAEIIIGEPAMELLDSYKKLKFIQMTWAGTDIYTRGKMDFPKDRISLSNASGAFGLSISQFIIGQILTLMFNFKTYHNQQNNKVWQRKSPIKSLVGAKVLIYGAGNIGCETAKRLVGFDTYNIGVCRDISKPRDYFDELCTLDEAEKYLPDVDVVICAIPNCAETAGYFDERRLALLKKDSIIVNVGRGNFIDNMALNEKLEKGDLWGAALDVTLPEPLPTDHPLWTNPRCMITPHASGVGFGHLEETEDILCDIVCQNIINYRTNKPLINKIY